MGILKISSTKISKKLNSEQWQYFLRDCEQGEMQNCHHADMVLLYS